MNNILKIRKKLEEKQLDALLVTDEKNQRYAAGFPFTDGAVLISRRSARIITDSRYIEAARIAVPDGVTVTLYDRERPLAACISACLEQEGIARLGTEEDRLSHAEFLRYEKALGRTMLPSCGLFTELRGAKSEEEIACMRRAQRIGEAALEEVLPLIKPGVAERDIAAELVYRMLRHGSEGNSFDPIVVTGTKTSMPHGVPGDRLIQAGDFVTMDFGCVKDGYCSDMTRTVAVGHADDEMKNVYGVVLEAQLAGIAAARPGLPGREIDAAARRVIARAGFGDFFGHGFGHSLGLDIHESPNLNPSGTAPMPEGAVCSAEPGIYLPGRFGVRIEDVMVLRRDGAEIITRAPKGLLIL